MNVDVIYWLIVLFLSCVLQRIGHQLAVRIR
jgi:hypothetical protein